MKEKLSITIERETLELIDKSIKEGKFRNKSHVVEFSVKKVIGGKDATK